MSKKPMQIKNTLDKFCKPKPVKKVLKNPLTGAIQDIRRALLEYKDQILNELETSEFRKQLHLFCGDEEHFLNILYANLSCNLPWAMKYSPQTTKDILAQDNVRFLRSWLRASYSTYRQQNGQSDQEESSEFQADDKYQYRMLNMHGCSGKLALLHAVAQESDIQVIFTYEYTKMKDFEEIFQSQKITFKKKVAISTEIFDAEESASKRKLIVHRGQLPSYFDKLEKRVPFIWVTQKLIDNSNFDEYKLIEPSHEIIANYLFRIMLIEENYAEQLAIIREEIKERMTYEVTIKKQFFKSLGMHKPRLEITELKVRVDQLALEELVCSFQGDIRKSLNWLQFNFNDENISQRVLEQLQQPVSLQYKIKQSLLKDHTEAQIDQECQEIQKARKKLLQTYRVGQDLYDLQQVIKDISLGNTGQQTRLRKLDYDPYKRVETLFKIPFEQFKVFQTLNF